MICERNKIKRLYGRTINSIQYIYISFYVNVKIRLGKYGNNTGIYHWFSTTSIYR